MSCKTYHTKSGKPIRLWQGDCMGLMGKDKEWDLAIVDPPYGIDASNMNLGEGGGLYREPKTYKRGDWDKDSPNTNYFSILFSLTNNQILWGANHYMQKICKGSSGWIFWDKNNGATDFSDGELAFTSFDKPVRKFKYTWSGFIQKKMGDQKESKIHPTQKPIDLYRWLLQNYANEGDRILDTHGGSMSLAIACYIEDFELDIIELDEDYYNHAVKRFEQHISQKTLF